MIIVFSSTGKTPDDFVDQRFGRAAYFLAIDSVTGAFEAQENRQNLQAAQGAGIQAAEAVCRLNAAMVVTGHCGPKAFRVLQAAEIPVITQAEGCIGDVMKRILSGELKPSSAPDVESHWL